MSTTAAMTDDDDHHPWIRAGLVTMRQRLAPPFAWKRKQQGYLTRPLPWE